ncbi:MAG: MMPL family transporter, partial [Candidatus Omnitrophica bacterium]|nr:MMPL family transporter [Candidatus Omnitrophota bacterium]
MQKNKVKISELVLRQSVPIIIAVAILTLFAAVFLPKIKIDNSIDVFFNKKGRSYIDFQEWKKQFGSDELIIAALELDQVFTQENLTLIYDITTELESVEYVDKVTSLTTVNNIVGIGKDFIVEKLVEEIPSSAAALKNIRDIAVSDDLYVKNVVSPDGKVAAFIIELEHLDDGDDLYKKHAIEDIEKIFEKRWNKYYISGLTTIEHYFALYMQDDLKAFIPFMMMMIMFILYLSFRRLKMIVLPMASIVVSLVFSMAFLYLLGYSINNVTTIIPPILMAIMIADSIHLMQESITAKEKAQASGQDEGDHSFLSSTMKHLMFPCFLTTLTTSIGFFSLTLSSVPPVRELGIVVGVGVFFALVVTFTFLPAMAKQMNAFSFKRIIAGTESKSLDRVLMGIGDFNKKNTEAVIFGTIVLVGFCIWGITKIKVETSVIEYFKKDSAVYASTVFIEDNLSGVHTLNISLKSSSTDYFKDPRSLKKIESLTKYLYTIPEVDKVISVNDYIKEINKSFHNEDKAYYVIPDSRELISQYVLLYGEDDMKDFMDSQWSWSTVQVRLKEHSTVKLKGVVDDIQKYTRAGFADLQRADVLGQTVLEVEANNTVTDGQVKSLGTAMIIIFLMMFIVFRSIPVGFVSIVPNILPILINFGIMGAVGIRLDSATSMIAVVGIGIVVDDTIHFLHGFGEAFKLSGDHTAAMYEALRTKGSPIICTSMILFFGFIILGFSKFVPTAYFGLLSAMLMLNALIADLIVLPCVLLFFKPRIKR